MERVIFGIKVEWSIFEGKEFMDFFGIDFLVVYKYLVNKVFYFIIGNVMCIVFWKKSCYFVICCIWGNGGWVKIWKFWIGDDGSVYFFLIMC